MSCESDVLPFPKFHANRYEDPPRASALKSTVRGALPVFGDADTVIFRDTYTVKCWVSLYPDASVKVIENVLFQDLLMLL